MRCRTWAADQINKMFGTDIWVEFIGNEIIAQITDVQNKSPSGSYSVQEVISSGRESDE